MDKLSQGQQVRLHALREAMILAKNGDNAMQIVIDAKTIERFLSGDEGDR